MKGARNKRDELAGQVAIGKDPARGYRKGFGEDSTLEEFGELYYAKQVLTTWKNPTHVRRYLDSEIFPSLGRKRLSEVSVLDIQALVYRKRDKGHVPAAMQLRGLIKRMFDYAIELQLVTSNPAAMVATRYIGRARAGLVR